MSDSLKKFIKSLGPGILFASTCIGVSHLVQSTRAGALYGFGLIWAVVIANLLKYPFFEYASRYTHATGTSIIDGYKKLGKWMLWLYALITLSTMFFVSAAVGIVTAGFMDNLFGISTHFGLSSTTPLIVILFAGCICILIFGKYKILDSLIKIIGTILLVSTLIAFGITLIKGPIATDFHFFDKSILSPTSKGFAFTLALMGWMPTALDASSWTSLWTLERFQQTNFKPSFKETLREFNFGYIVTVILAPCFLVLGAFLVYGSNTELPNNPAAFANSIVNLFTSTMGDWTYIFIASSSFSIMFGTCIAVFDGYARASERVIILMRSNNKKATSNRLYNLSLLIVAIGSFCIALFFGTSLKQLVDIATTISFIVAPIIAIANFRLVTSKLVNNEHHPSKSLRLLSWAGIVFLSFFSLIYIFYH